jgi:hypothetical protein
VYVLFLILFLSSLNLIKRTTEKGSLAFVQIMDLIYGSPAFSLFPDRCVEDSWTARAESCTRITSDYKGTTRTWELSRDLAKFPTFSSDNVLIDAL